MINGFIAEFKDRALETEYLKTALDLNQVQTMLIYIALMLPNLFQLFVIYLEKGFEGYFAEIAVINCVFFLVVLASCRNFLGSRDPHLMHRLHLIIWFLFAIVHFSPLATNVGLGPYTLTFIPLLIFSIHFLLPLPLVHILVIELGVFLIAYYDIYWAGHHYYHIDDLTFWILAIISALVSFIARNVASKQRRYLFGQWKKELQLSAEKEELFAILAHDLRAPINTQAQLLRLANMFWGVKKPEEIKDLILKVGGSTEHMSRLIDNMLGWSRVKNGAITLYYEPINLSILFREIGEILQLSLKQKEIQLMTPPKEREVIVNADVNLLRTVLLNLVNNAIKYSPSKSDIQITYRNNESSVLIGIKDKGVGMSAEKIALILEGSNSMSLTGTQGETGTGLGLRVSLKFIQKLGGTLEIQSSLGAGANFLIQLPSNK